jgi:putative nucleotidyltransferase with HDIG domain
MQRQRAFKILKKNMTKPNLIKHSLAVEAVMKRFAEKHGEDVEFWGNVGLLHDVDYESYPDKHCHMTEVLLKPEGVDNKTIRAIVSHGYGLCTDIKPEEYMEKVLVTTDQLTGFITACALILPEKKLESVTLQSMLKKWPKKDFAGGTQRERIEMWAKELNLPLDYLLTETLDAMKGIAADLGL